MTPQEIIFLLTGIALLGSALMVVTRPNLVHAALWLVMTLAGVAVLFLLLESDFLAMVQVAVYIGAIAIMLIFVVMLTRKPSGPTDKSVTSTWWVAAIVALIFFAGLIAVLQGNPGFDATLSEAAPDTTAQLTQLGTALVDVDGFILPFEVASVLLLAALVGAFVVARPSSKEEREGEDT